MRTPERPARRERSEAYLRATTLEALAKFKPLRPSAVRSKFFGNAAIFF